MEKIFVAKSDIRVEYIDSIDQFIQYAEKIDNIFIKLYGKSYPHQLAKSIQKIGPDSRAIAVWFGDILIGYTGFIQDEKHNRVEFGRLFKHPDYDFNIMVMDQYLNRAIEEFHRDKEKLLFATTRLWISSAYMELLQFTMCGSFILPLPIQSTWGGNTCYPYFGVYNYPLEDRIKKTYKIPKWIGKLFPRWTDLFNKFSGGLDEINIPLDYYEEIFPPENPKLKIEPSKLSYIPCVNDQSIIDYTSTLIEKGYSIFAFFPSWERIPINKKDSNYSYVSVILLGNLKGRIENPPKKFALSAIHYDFIKNHFCNKMGMDILYQEPMKDLFRRRSMGWFRRLMIRFIDRFYQVKVYSLFSDYSIDESISQIFG